MHGPSYSLRWCSREGQGIQCSPWNKTSWAIWAALQIDTECPGLLKFNLFTEDLGIRFFIPADKVKLIKISTWTVKDGELPVLPLSVYGSVVMAHSEVSEEYSSQNQFFFYLYDKRNVSNMTCFFFFLLFSPNYFL